MWQKLPDAPHGTIDPLTMQYPYVMDLYNAYDPLVFKVAGNAVMFYADVGTVDPGYLGDIRGNNGHATILPVPMWTGGQASGAWSFMAPCKSVQFITDDPCAQTPTTGATGTGGVQLAVSPSYQITYASLPFRSTGVLGGLTLKKQFEAAFQLQPDYVFISGFNERISNLIPPTADPGSSMGLEQDASAQGVAFTDVYGVDYTRDVEPTAEYGTLVIDTLASCLRVFRSGTPTCSDLSEACCQNTEFSALYTNILTGPQFFGVAAVPGNGTLPLYKCGGTYATQACSGDAVGYISSVKGGATLRALYACRDGSYSVGSACAGTRLGYVR